MGDKIVLKPFVKWVGGKTQLLPEIEKRLPNSFDTYIEPFIGGGSVLIHLLQNRNDIKTCYINDLNKDLIYCYESIAKYSYEIITAMHLPQTLYNNFLSDEERKDMYLSVRNGFNLNNDEPFMLLPEAQEMSMINYKTSRAAQFIFLNKTCFNGLYRVNKNGEFNVPWNKKEKITLYDKENIYGLSELFKNVNMFCGDYSEMIKYVDDKTFVYLDPPYKPVSKTSSFNSYNKDNFNDDEQLRLKLFCDEINKRGGKFMLSNSYTDDNFFEDLYKDYKIEYIKAKRMINSKGNKRGEINEILITNY